MSPDIPRAVHRLSSGMVCRCIVDTAGSRRDAWTRSSDDSPAFFCPAGAPPWNCPRSQARQVNATPSSAGKTRHPDTRDNSVAIDLLNAQGARLAYQPGFLSPTDEPLWRTRLENGVEFDRPETSSVFVHGKWRAIPRRQCAHGDDDCPGYRFSGTVVKPRPWIGPLRDLRDLIAERTGFRRTSCWSTTMRTPGSTSPGTPTTSATSTQMHPLRRSLWAARASSSSDHVLKVSSRGRSRCFSMQGACF